MAELRGFTEVGPTGLLRWGPNWPREVMCSKGFPHYGSRLISHSDDRVQRVGLTPHSSMPLYARYWTDHSTFGYGRVFRGRGAVGPSGIAR